MSEATEMPSLIREAKTSARSLRATLIVRASVVFAYASLSVFPIAALAQDSIGSEGVDDEYERVTADHDGILIEYADMLPCDGDWQLTAGRTGVKTVVARLKDVRTAPLLHRSSCVARRELSVRVALPPGSYQVRFKLPQGYVGGKHSVVVAR